MDFTWTVTSVDAVTHTMQVEYIGNTTVLLNIPLPPTGTEIGEWVSKFTPKSFSTEPAVTAVAVGTSGTGTVAATAATASSQTTASETATTVGSWDEEYLRALIYQVLDEVEASKV